MSKCSIITGIGGQDGAYLAHLLLKKGYKVVGFVRNGKEKSNLPGLAYLGIERDVRIIGCDLCDYDSVVHQIVNICPDEIYHLAAQSSVGESFVRPGETLMFNMVSTLILARILHECAPGVRMYQASSSEMFGHIPSLPITEDMAFHPLSPYAVSKAASHWIAKNYRESFGVFIACGILFNHESPLRSRNFFVKKLICEAIEVKFGRRRHIMVGNLDVRRDFGYAPKYVEAMYLMLQRGKADDFLICSGKSISLRSIALHVCERVGISPDVLITDPRLFRPLDIPDIYGSNRRANDLLGWKYNLEFIDVLDIMIQDELERFS